MDRIATDAENNAMTAANHFTSGVARNLGNALDFLAQDRGDFGHFGKPVQQLIDYMTNDYNENDQKLYDSAVQALDQLQKDPASFFGEHAMDMIPSGPLGKEAEMGRAMSAARRAAAMEHGAQEFGAFQKGARQAENAFKAQQRAQQQARQAARDAGRQPPTHSRAPSPDRQVADAPAGRRLDPQQTPPSPQADRGGPPTGGRGGPAPTAAPSRPSNRAPTPRPRANPVDPPPPATPTAPRPGSRNSKRSSARPTGNAETPAPAIAPPPLPTTPRPAAPDPPAPSSPSK
jgi:hypothetical protein